MIKLKAVYDVGWFAGYLRYHIDFLDEGIVFYSRKKDKSFTLKYDYIKYSDISYMLINALQVGLWLKSDPLNDIDPDKAIDIKKWFPPAIGRGISILGNRNDLLYINLITDFKFAKEIETLLSSKHVYIRISPFKKNDINHINKPLKDPKFFT